LRGGGKIKKGEKGTINNVTKRKKRGGLNKKNKIGVLG